jgi:hypothetical protein
MSTRTRLLLSCVLITLVAFAVRPRAQSPTAAFHGIGDLQGGPTTSFVRDATRGPDGRIYAVGGSGSAANPQLFPPFANDTPILWTWDGLNAVVTALPNLVTNTRRITPDAAYIASQARNTTTTNSNRAVRVATNGLVNLDLSAAPFTYPTGVFPPGASAISDNGSILYGVSNANQALRFDVNAGIVTFIPLVPGTTSGNPPALHGGTTASGSMVVGTSFTAPFFGSTGGRAYRYVHGSPGSLITVPLLFQGSTWNKALGIKADGGRLLLAGDSTFYPKGEHYFRELVSPFNNIALGSPNSAWFPMNTGGMTDDGSVVVASYAGSLVGTTFPSQFRYPYFRNSHGWFRLESALEAAGIDLPSLEWERLQVTGISRDGRLVFGGGTHSGNAEGFVAEFAAGYLANFDAPPVPPSNTSIVGTWKIQNPEFPDEKGDVVVFMADGTFFDIALDTLHDGADVPGMERGTYNWNPATGRLKLTTLVDTNGGGGTSEINGTSLVTLAINGDSATLGFGPDSANSLVITRVTGSQGTLVGAWGYPDIVIVFLDDSTFLFAEDNPDHATDGQDGIEIGTYSWNPGTGEFSGAVSLDTNGETGVSVSGAPIALNVSLSADRLGLVITADDGSFPFPLVIDPATIPVITSTPLSASGVVGTPFSYTVTATNTLTYGAMGLPDGLSINAGSGTISGTPTVGGQFAASILATNTAGVSDIETLTLTIAVGQNVVVEPEVPEGQGPISLTFGEVTEAGTTTVTVLDLDESTVPPPGSVDVAGVIYEVQTTAQYSGLITVCFSYAGIDFGGADPRLFHYENNVWVDITTSVDPSTQTICGSTTSLSPFAVLVSHVVRTGFYAPVNPSPGFLNSVQSGATVPLKFNVSVNGITKTTTDGLVLTIQPISCDSSAPLDEVEPAAISGGSGLRYDATAGYFVQNWKAPKAAGCYMVRVTTTQDGLALTARFKVR